MGDFPRERLDLLDSEDDNLVPWVTITAASLPSAVGMFLRVLTAIPVFPAIEQFVKVNPSKRAISQLQKIEMHNTSSDEIRMAPQPIYQYCVRSDPTASLQSHAHRHGHPLCCCGQGANVTEELSDYSKGRS
ncbi:hypothetical protein KIN20_028541 [Parelaphostrongylus tenuis]|uniref:Uncharacterized protein n=1 Tax=Parelaphostrongylus tenuis TaxID=148309 RepID=A0AAD5R0Z3_PARTN|nr:hypothetical protein KIN20_028541 [Parelaphostrongylus tenuis]